MISYERYAELLGKHINHTITDSEHNDITLRLPCEANGGDPSWCRSPQNRNGQRAPAL